MQDDRKQDPKHGPGEDTRGVDFTRREWFLRLGGSAVLAGFRGVPFEGSAAGQSAPPQAGAGLPPGLYEASEDHMTHALTSDERFHPVPPGSETDFVRPPHGPFQPQFFSPPEFQVVRRLVALVLGETEGSAGAQEVISEVSEWIDLDTASSGAIREAARQVSAQHRTLITAFHGKDRIADIEARDPANVWREGLAWLSAASQQRWGSEFLAEPTSSQTELLQELSNARPAENAGTRLFVLLKRQVIRGFYTSRTGLTELEYKGNSFNAECPGCGLPRPTSSENQ